VRIKFLLARTSQTFTCWWPQTSSCWPCWPLSGITSNAPGPAASDPSDLNALKKLQRQRRYEKRTKLVFCTSSKKGVRKLILTFRIQDLVDFLFKRFRSALYTINQRFVKSQVSLSSLWDSLYQFSKRNDCTSRNLCERMDLVNRLQFLQGLGVGRTNFYLLELILIGVHRPMLVVVVVWRVCIPGELCWGRGMSRLAWHTLTYIAWHTLTYIAYIHWHTLLPYIDIHCFHTLTYIASIHWHTRGMSRLAPVCLRTLPASRGRRVARPAWLQTNTRKTCLYPVL